MKYIFTIFFVFIIISFNSAATNIRVIDLNVLIDQNNNLISLISKIEDDQKIHREKFKETELKFELELERIDELKLILEESALQKEINNYNQEFGQFNSDIERFNTHYDNQINALRNKILKELLEILKKYSVENEIELILDSNSYILSSNSINITNIILEELNKINFDTSFEKFK